MSSTTHTQPKGRRYFQRESKDKAYAKKLQDNNNTNNEVLSPSRSATNNSRNTTTRQSNTSNNETNQQTISTRRSSTTTANNTTTTTGQRSNNKFDGAPSASTTISTTGTQDDTPLDTNTTPNYKKHHQTIPKTCRSSIANGTSTTSTSPILVFDSASRSAPTKSLLTNSISSKGGTSDLLTTRKKRGLNDVEKRSTATPSGSVGGRITRRRCRRDTISTTTPQRNLVSNTSTSLKFPPSQYNKAPSNKKKSSKKDVKKKSTTDDVVPGGGRRKHLQRGKTTNTTSHTITKQNTTKSSDGKTTYPLTLQSPNKDKGIGGRHKPRRIVEGTVVKKKVLFSSPDRASTNGGDILGRGRKRKVRDYNEDDDDGSVTSIDSDSTLSGFGGLLDDGGAMGAKQHWVQCEECDLWRKLPPDVNPSQLSGVWKCSMNTWSDSSRNCCSAPLEEDSADEDDGADDWEESFSIVSKPPAKKKTEEPGADEDEEYFPEESGDKA